MPEMMHAHEEPRHVDPPVQVEETPVEPKVEQVDQAFLRLAADYRNLENRSRSARAEGYLTGKEEACSAFFPLLDQFEMSIQSTKATTASERERIEKITGIVAMKSTLEAAMKTNGMEKVETTGAFHPSTHEAVGETFSDIPAGDIVAVTQSGWSLNGKLIRPAKVIVSRGSEFAPNPPPPVIPTPRPPDLSN
jgi:molecular chaperone GrpE